MNNRSQRKTRDSSLKIKIGLRDKKYSIIEDSSVLNSNSIVVKKTTRKKKVELKDEKTPVTKKKLPKKKKGKSKNVNDENKDKNLNDESNQSFSLILNDEKTEESKIIQDHLNEELVEFYDYSDIKIKDEILPAYKEEKDQLFSIIENSLDKGNSSSCVIIGYYGTGKTELVNYCLGKQAKDAQIIELHGKFDTNYEKIVKKIGSYLDINKPDFSSIMSQLKINSTQKVQKIIFVLDYFAEFCTKNQLLIYNLFNILQYINNVLIICKTIRYDCFELIEKRVKSRMNFKTIYLNGPYKNFNEYVNFARKLLSKDDIKLTKRFYNSLEIQYSKSCSINQLKECLLENISNNISDINININKNTNKIIKSMPDTDETINIICENLSKLDLCVLLICAKIVYIKRIENFNFNFMLKYRNEIPTHITDNRRKIMNSLCNLIDKKLVVKNEVKSESNLYFTEFTSLRLNVFQIQIKESLKILDNKISHTIKRIFSLQA